MRARSALLLAALVGCGGQTLAEQPAESGHSGGSGGAGLRDAAGGPLEAGKGGASGSAAFDSGGPAQMPPDIPSRQTVTFRLNNGASEKWVVTAVVRGVAFSIKDLVVSRFMDVSCGCRWLCEVGMDGCGPISLTHVAPNETLSIVWDARHFVRGEVPVACPDSPDAAGYVIHWVAEPAAAGTYVVTFGYDDTAPTAADGCNPQGQDYSCAACLPPKDSVQQSFVLPPSGDVTVDVSLGAGPSEDAAADQTADDAHTGE